MLSQIILGCLLLILFISIYNVYNDNIEYEITNFIDGCWQSDPTFATLSELDDMILMLNSKDMSGVLVIIMNQYIKVNGEFDLKITNINKKNDIYTFDMKIISDDFKFVWFGKEFNCILSIYKGYIEIYENDTMMAKLIKNNNMTNVFV